MGLCLTSQRPLPQGTEVTHRRQDGAAAAGQQRELQPRLPGASMAGAACRRPPAAHPRTAGLRAGEPLRQQPRLEGGSVTHNPYPTGVPSVDQ